MELPKNSPNHDFPSDDERGLRHHVVLSFVLNALRLFSVPSVGPPSSSGFFPVAHHNLPIDSPRMGNEMASVQPYGDGWRVQVYKNGVRDSATFDKKRDAEAWGKRREVELSSHDKRAAHSLDRAVRLYIETVSSRKRSQEWERRRLDAMLEYFGPTTQLRKIGTETISQWKNDRLQTVSGSTVNREANLLRNLFSVAVNEWRWIDRNPFQGVKLPKEAEPRSSLWGWREIRRMLRHCENAGDKTQEVGRAFHIALRTGMRLGEVLNTPGALRDGVVTLPHSKTSAKPVKVPVGRVAARLIAECPPFTVGANEASALFVKARRQAGLPDALRFHDARATALTHMSRRVDALTLAKVSRHKDLSLLLNVYYRDTPEAIAKRL